MKWWDKLWKGEKASMDNIYNLNGRVPLWRSVPYGLQHILAMFVANLGPIFVVAGACGLNGVDTARLVQVAMIIAGIGTLVQLFPLWRVGSGLPIVMGISFTFVGVFCSIGDYPTIVGAVIIGGLVEGLLGLFAKYWRKIISPIVAASVVTAIGVSLLSIGATSFGGGATQLGILQSGLNGSTFGNWQHWTLGSVTLLSCILFNIFAKGHWKQLSVLFGLVVGYILALVLHFAVPSLNLMDFSAFSDMAVISFPLIPTVAPKFDLGAIISVTMIFLVSATETIGDTSALAESALGRQATDKEIAGSLACDGLVSAISGGVGCLPVTSFSQNVGLVSMTKVVNRFTIATGAIIMILSGIFPVFGAVFATLPEAVLGGCTLMMFGMIVVSGLQMVAKCGFTQRNITIASLSLSIGVGFTLVKELFHAFPPIIVSIFADNCVAVAFVVAIVLNLVLPKDMETGKPKTETAPEPIQTDGCESEQN